MTPAMVLATLGAVSAAAGVVELLGARADRRRRRLARPGVRERLVAAMVRLGRRLGAPAPPRDLAARIAAAGAPLGLGSSEMASVKAAAGALVLLMGAPLALALPGRLPWIALPALPLAGYLTPDLLLARMARRRGRAMEEELPDLLDLLRVSVEAGLSVSSALEKVGRGHSGQLASEWRTAAAQIELGVPRGRALERMSARCPAPAVAALVAALERAERHGAPLSQTLAAQAHEARAARARLVRERAARAAPKIQLVVALLLVPSVLLMVAAAILSSLAD